MSKKIWFVIIWKNILPVSILLCIICPPVHGQQKKNKGITDGFGVFAGMNLQQFWTDDYYNDLEDRYNVNEMVAPMYGLSYYHSYSPRISNIWQLRFTHNKMNFTEIDRRFWNVSGERVLVKQDSGDFKINYQVMSINYSLGYTLNKKLGWSLYGGFQINMTLDNQSTKTIDRVEYGEVLTNHTYKPYSAPQYQYDLTLPTYGADSDPVIIVRTDMKWNLKKTWMIRPALELDILSGFHHLPIKTNWALFVEVYHLL